MMPTSGGRTMRWRERGQPAFEEMAPPEEEYDSDVLAVGEAEDDQGAATEVGKEKEGGGHPVLTFIGRLLRRLRELWPF